MTDGVVDAALRQAAFDHVAQIQRARGGLTSEDIAAGFTVGDRRIPLVNPQRGIFKPRELRHLLSIRTVYPRPGGRVWYHDQTGAHDAVYQGAETIGYAFMGRDPDVAENRWLREAADQQVPIIYFLGTAPGRYVALLPTFVMDWSAERLEATIAFAPLSASAAARLPDAAERRYGMRQAKQRLHQMSFRERVLAAYDQRCAITGLPEPRLIDAAHIIRDGDEELGQPIIANGLSMSKLHHAAFDANLIGIDADFRIHVSPILLDQNDGPLLEQGIKRLHGQHLRFPRRDSDRPDRERLARRFMTFLG